jgi:hypothetical protein
MAQITRRTGMRTRILAVLSAVALLTAACAGDPASNSGDSGSGGGLSLRIVEPAGDASVSTPFTVRVESSVPLGSTESGKHHIHVWFDDKANDYQVVEADHVSVDSGKLPSGQHVIHASLRNANHSAAGAEAEASVMVTAANATDPEPSPTQTDNGGYGY